MAESFWELGERFWMQIMDDKYHEYGSMVFDQALINLTSYNVLRHTYVKYLQ